MRIKNPYWIYVAMALLVLALVIYFTNSFDWLFESDDELKNIFP